MRLKAITGIVLTVFLLGTLTLTFVVQPVAADAAVDWWPMFRHDLNHTGYSASTAPNTNNTIWSYTTGNDVYSSPAVSDGKVYVGSSDNKIYCFNASTGTHIWNYTTGDMVYSSPAVADGKVYVGSWDNKVYAFAPDTTKPSIGTVLQEPQIPDDGEGVTITVNVTDEESGVHNVTISYRTNSGPWTNVSMSKLTGDTWEGEIPGQSAGANVQYKIIAYDKAGNFKVDDQGGEYYVYTVIPEFSTWTSTLLILIILTVAIATYKRRLLKTPIH